VINVHAGNPLVVCLSETRTSMPVKKSGSAIQRNKQKRYYYILPETDGQEEEERPSRANDC
jgi:hypothetical protein